MIEMIFIGLWSVLLAGAIGMLIRNQMVWKAHKQALNFISKEAHYRIANDSTLNMKWMELYDLLNSYPPYDKMVWQWNKWSYKTLFKDLEKKALELR